MESEKSVKKTKKKRVDWKWVVTIFSITIIISAFFSFFSTALLNQSGIFAALAILLVIICIGIAFDMVGVAVTAADPQPFHAMAAKKVPGASEALRLLRKAERVSSFCNDVVGDICGVISGSASAVIAVRVIANFSFRLPSLLELGMSAMVAGLTVGGKAVGKGFAMNNSTQLVSVVGRVLHFFRQVFGGKRKSRRH